MGERAHTPGRLGSRQIRRLASLAAIGRAFVVGDKELRRLADLGLVRPVGPDSFYHLTSSGLRMLARLADEGRINLAPELPSKGLGQRAVANLAKSASPATAAKTGGA